MLDREILQGGYELWVDLVTSRSGFFGPLIS